MEEILKYILSAELLGLIATAITLYSFSIKYSLEFRKVNIFASVLWVIYALSISSASIFITNAIITSMHVYHLYSHYFRGIALSSKPPKEKA